MSGITGPGAPNSPDNPVSSQTSPLSHADQAASHIAQQVIQGQHSTGAASIQKTATKQAVDEFFQAFVNSWTKTLNQLAERLGLTSETSLLKRICTNMALVTASLSKRASPYLTSAYAFVGRIAECLVRAMLTTDVPSRETLESIDAEIAQVLGSVDYKQGDVKKVVEELKRVAEGLEKP